MKTKPQPQNTKGSGSITLKSTEVSETVHSAALLAQVSATVSGHMLSSANTDGKAVPSLGIASSTGPASMTGFPEVATKASSSVHTPQMHKDGKPWVLLRGEATIAFILLILKLLR